MVYDPTANYKHYDPHASRHESESSSMLSHRCTNPSQVHRSYIVLEGHNESVNTMRFSTDLRLLLSGGKFIYITINAGSVTTRLDNSGHLILWDLSTGGPLQKIDASFAGPVTAVCWIKLHDGSRDDDDGNAFAIGSGTGMISIFKQSTDAVRYTLFMIRTSSFSLRLSNSSRS